MSLSVVILAAGKGTRMFSDKPKVLHKLANQFLLQYVIDIAKNLQPKNINIVVGYKFKEVEQAFPNEKLNWVFQKKQLGTGDAVKYAIPHLTSSQTMVLYGDVPMVELNDLKHLIKKSENGKQIRPPFVGALGFVGDGFHWRHLGAVPILTALLCEIEP